MSKEFKKRIFALVALIIFLGFILFNFFLKTSLCLYARLKTGGKLSIQTFKLQPRATLFKNITFINPQKEKILEVSEINIRLNWKKFIQTRNIKNLFYNIRITKPVVYIKRYSDKEWSTSFLSKGKPVRKKVKRPPIRKKVASRYFQGEVSVTEGKIFIIDDKIAKQKTELSKINFLFNGKLQNPLINVSFKEAASESTFQAKGNIDISKDWFTLRFTGKNIKLPHYVNYLFVDDSFKICSGYADVDLVFYAKGSNLAQTLDYQGILKISDGNIKAKLIPYDFAKIKGTIELATDILYSSNLRGYFGEIPIRAQGSLFNFEWPCLNLELTAPEGFYLRNLENLWLATFNAKLDGRASGFLGVTGQIDSLLFTGHIISPSADFNQENLTNSYLNFRFIGDTFEILDFSTHWKGNKLSTTGWCFLRDNPQLMLSCQAEGFNLIKVLTKGFRLKLPVLTVLDFDILGAPEKPLVLCRGSFKDMQGSNKGDFSFLYDKDTLYLKKAHMGEKPNSGLKGFGFVDLKDSQMFLNFYGDKFLLPLIDFEQFSDLTGRFNFGLNLMGSFKDWILKGVSLKSQFSLGKFTGAGLSGNFYYDSDGFLLERGTFFNKGKPAYFSGICSPDDGFTYIALNTKKFNWDLARYIFPRLKEIRFSRPVDINFFAFGNPKSGYFYNGLIDNPSCFLNIEGLLHPDNKYRQISLLRLKNIGLDTKQPFNFKGNLTGEALFLGKPSRDFKSYGLLNFESCSALGVPIERALWNIENKGSFYKIKDVALDNQSASVRLKGRFGREKINLDYKLSCSNLDTFKKLKTSKISFLDITKNLGWDDFQGELDSTGVIKIQDKEVSLYSKLNQAQFSINKELINLDGAFRYKNKALYFEPLVFSQNITEQIICKGYVNLTQPDKINLRLLLNSLDLARLINITPLKTTEIKGTASGSLKIEGSLKQPAFDGNLNFKKLEAFNQTMESLSLSFSSQKGVLELSKLNLQVNKGRAVGKGRLDKLGNLDFKLQAQSFPLNEIPYINKILETAEGYADIQISVSGTKKNPQLAANFHAKKIKLNNDDFSEALGKVRWANSYLYLEPLLLRQINPVKENIPSKLSNRANKKKTAEYNLTGHICFPICFPRGELPSGSKRKTKIQKSFIEGVIFDLDLNVSKGRLFSLLNLLKLPFKDKFSGSLQGQLKFKGTLVEPEIDLAANLKDSMWGEAKVDSLNCDLQFKSNNLSINNLDLKQKDGFLKAQGNINFEGDSQLDLKARSLDLRIFDPFMPKGHSLSGFGNLDLSIKGDRFSPHIVSDFSIKPVTVDSFKFDQFKGKILGDSGFIGLVDCQLIKGKHRALASGKFPLIWKKGNFYTSAPVDLKASFSEDDLSLLNIFAPIVEESKGEFFGNLFLIGPLDQVDLKGNILVKNGELQPVDFDNKIENLNIDLTLENNELKIKKFQGKTGNGNFKLTGSMTFDQFKPKYLDYKFFADNALLKSPKYCEGILTGQLFLTGDWNSPGLSGELKLHDGTLNLGNFRGFSSFTPAPAKKTFAGKSFPLWLDLTLNRVWLISQSKMMDTFFKSSGFLQIRGSVSTPTLLGEINFTQGNIVFYNTSFRVTGGKAYFDGTHRWSPKIDLEAETTVGGARVFVSISGDLEHPAAEFTSDPPMRQDEIFQLLALKVMPLQVAGGAATEEVSKYLMGGLQMRILQPLVQSLVRELALGSVSLDYTLPGYWSIKLATAIDPDEKFWVTYSRAYGVYGVPGEVCRIWGLEYKLQRRTTLRVSQDDRGQRFYGIQARYQF